MLSAIIQEAIHSLQARCAGLESEVTELQWLVKEQSERLSCLATSQTNLVAFCEARQSTQSAVESASSSSSAPPIAIAAGPSAAPESASAPSTSAEGAEGSASEWEITTPA